jgi:hypothetical protein
MHPRFTVGRFLVFIGVGAIAVAAPFAVLTATGTFNGAAERQRREVDDDRGLDLEQNVEKRAWARDYTMHPQPGHADAQRQRGGRTRSPPRDH